MSEPVQPGRADILERDILQFAHMDAGGFRRLVRQRLDALDEPEQGFGDFTFNPDFRDWVMERAVKPAAVLIPVISHADGLSVLLTQRTEALSSHSGQIAFPGGRIDPGDESAIAAALREAQEEVGLDPANVEVVGQMPDYLTGSGYRIAPVIGLVDPNAPLRANPDEVAHYFEVPLSFLMDRENHRTGSKEFFGKRRYFLEMPFGEHHIWGVTAGIIRVMHDMLVPW